MFRYLQLVLVCAVALQAGAAVAQGIPSFRGYTGLVLIPTADTLDEGEFNLGLMTEEVDEFEMNDMFITYGLSDGLEIGFNSFKPIETGTIDYPGDDYDYDFTALAVYDDRDRETLLHGKYRLMPETVNRAGVAFGLIDLTDEMETTAYVVASKSLARGLTVFDNEIVNLRGHIGFGGGSLDGLFAGLSAFLGNRAMVSVEYDSHNPNIGFRFAPVRGIRLHAAWFDVGDEDEFGTGVSFSHSY